VSWFSGAPRIALLVNPNLASAATAIKEAQAAASAIGQQIDVFHASTNREIDTAFAALIQRQDAAVLVIPDALFFDRGIQLVTLAVRHAVPAISSLLHFDLLRARRERPRRSRAAEQCDEVAPLHLRAHSITSSALGRRLSALKTLPICQPGDQAFYSKTDDDAHRPSRIRLSPPIRDTAGIAAAPAARPRNCANGKMIGLEIPPALLASSI
jgi:hypothetical protein